MVQQLEMVVRGDLEVDLDDVPIAPQVTDTAVFKKRKKGDSVYSLLAAMYTSLKD